MLDSTHSEINIFKHFHFEDKEIIENLERITIGASLVNWIFFSTEKVAYVQYRYL